MGALKTYETFVHGNIDENEILKIKIFSHEPISEYEIEKINKMRLYEVQDIGKIKGWQIFINNNK